MKSKLDRIKMVNTSIWKIKAVLHGVLFWLLDKAVYENELKIKTPGASRGFYNFSANVGSQSLTYGAQDWT